MFYKLNSDKSISPCSLLEWSEQLEEIVRCGSDSKVVRSEVIDGKLISTVWLGLDHSHMPNNAMPLVFETMVFNQGDYNDFYCDRYSIWDQAVEGHERAKQWVLSGMKNND